MGSAFVVECFFSFPRRKGTQELSLGPVHRGEAADPFVDPGRWDSGYQPLHPGVHEGKVSEHVLVHAVDQSSVCARQPGLLIQEFLVEVAAVMR